MEIERNRLSYYIIFREQPIMDFYSTPPPHQPLYLLRKQYCTKIFYEIIFFTGVAYFITRILCYYIVFTK